MTVRGPRHSFEEFARLGQKFYDEKVVPTLRPEDKDLFVAIDIESGEFAIHPKDVQAIQLLYERCPDAQPWLMRVGHRGAYRMGMRSVMGCGKAFVLSINTDQTDDQSLPT